MHEPGPEQREESSVTLGANVSGRLRNRLMAIILLPLLLAVLIFTYETYRYAEEVSRKNFDKSLSILSVTLMEQSDSYAGDALSEHILESITNSLGHVFFYQLRAEDSSLLAGYSNAPLADAKVIKAAAGRPQLFTGHYRDRPVRAVYLRNFWNNESYQGWVGITVWQFFEAQHQMRDELFARSLIRLVLLLLLVAGMIWLGIDYALRPLSRLENSINRRSIDDLTFIQQSVPLEVKSLVESMNSLLARLKSAISNREAFLGNASHQLKTPLANIRSRAELALEAKDENTRQEQLDALLTMTDQTSRLATQMLSLLRAESEAWQTHRPEAVDLVLLCREVCECYALPAVKQRRELVYEHDGLDKLEIRIPNPSMLRESIGNLIENGMSYSREEGQILVRIQCTNDMVQILIQDEGPGIPKEYQQEVFRRFYRLPGSQPNGCGIGLSIVQQTIKNLQGTLRFAGPESDCFTTKISIPLWS